MTSNKFTFLIVFFLLISFKLVSQEQDDDSRQKLEAKLSAYIEQGTEQLRGTDNLTLFLDEQRLWESYYYWHFQTLFPDKINKVRMRWGTIISNVMGREDIKLNESRKKVLERYFATKSPSKVDDANKNNKILDDLKKSETKILKLETLIKKNLQGTTVLALFQREIATWNSYTFAHIKMVSTGALINAEQVNAEQLLMNFEHIEMLEDYMKEREAGTDGSGKFKEYVEELHRIFGEEK